MNNKYTEITKTIMTFLLSHDTKNRLVKASHNKLDSS